MASTFNIFQKGEKETVNFDFILETNMLRVTSINSKLLSDIEDVTVDIQNAQLDISCKNAWVKENTIELSIKMTNVDVNGTPYDNIMQLEVLVFDHIITLPIDLSQTNSECTTDVGNALRYDNHCLKEQWGDTAFIDFKCVFAPKGNPNMTCTLLVHAEYDVHTTV